MDASSLEGGPVGWNSEQPCLMEDVPTHGRGAWNEVIFMVSSNPVHSMILL